MNTTVNYKLINLKDSLDQLDYTLKKLHEMRADQEKYDAVDIRCFKYAAIKEFEWCYRRFKNAISQDLLLAHEHNLILEMADTNEIVGSYFDKTTAEKVCTRIPVYHALMSEIAKRIKA